MIQNFRSTRPERSARSCCSASSQTAFGDPYRQEITKDGTPQWVAQLAAEFRAFGRPQCELINVGVTCEKDPGEGLMPGRKPTRPAVWIDPIRDDGDLAAVQNWIRCTSFDPSLLPAHLTVLHRARGAAAQN